MHQDGFLNIGLGIIITVLAILGTSTYFLISKQTPQTSLTPTATPAMSSTISQPPPSPKTIMSTVAPKPTATSISTPLTSSGQATSTPAPSITHNSNATASVIWSTRDSKWSPSGTPPACPEPFDLQTPVDMSLVTAALWPGQVRGGYKAHGGFRFNNDGTNNITVRAPVGGHLIQASQYLEGGEKQYFLVFSVPCGFVYRLDHPRVLSQRLSEAVKNLPTGAEGDSRTSYINPPVWVDAGEIVATSIGVTKNIFVDFGLYDVRKPNNITPNPAWAELYAADKEFGHYGVCFFDYLPGNDGTTMRSLPTGKEGKVSDYCK